MDKTLPQSDPNATDRYADLILAASGDGIYGVGVDGLTTFANPAALRMCGFDHDEIVGFSAHNLIHHTHIDGSPHHSVNCPIYAAFKDGAVHRIEDDIFWRKDGSSFPVEYVSTPIYDEDKLVGAVVSFRDISARKEAARALCESEQRARDLQSDLHHVSRLSAMGEMASGLAHEVNQPLTALTSYVQAAKRTLAAGNDGASETAIELMDKAAAQALRASGIIRGLRQFVVKDGGELAREDLGGVIEEAMALSMTGGQAARVALTVTIAPGTPAVMIEKIRVQQVLVNLVRNAVEALSDTPGAHVTVSAASAGQNTVEVRVCDNGPGLSQDVDGRLFQSFVSSKPSGMGVGLSISRSIVEDHGGRLVADRNDDCGMTFRFTLPVASA